MSLVLLILTHEVCQLLFKTAAWSSCSKIIPAHWKGLTTPSLIKLTANHWILPLLSHGVADFVINWEKSPHREFFLTFRPHYFIQITTDQGRISSAIWSLSLQRFFVCLSPDWYQTVLVYHSFIVVTVMATYQNNLYN